MTDSFFYGVSAALIVLALVLRVYRIGALELWLDEAFSHYVATLPNWFASILIDNNPPGYYLLLRGWVRIAGTTETSLRLLSALWGTAFVGLSIWAGRELFSRAAGLWAGLIAALSPIQIYYAQEARVYALLDVLLLLSVLLAWRALSSNRLAHWFQLGLVFSLALYCHYLAVIALLPAALLAWTVSDRQRRVRYAVTAAASVTLFLPWLIRAFLFADRAATGTSWIENVWKETPKLLAIPLSLEIFALGSEPGLVPLWMHNFDRAPLPAALRVLGLGALVALGIAAAVPWGDAKLGIPGLLVRKRCVTALLFVPLAIFWLISWVKPIYAVGRYDFLVYPPFALLAGFALWKIQRNWTLLAAGALGAALLIPVCAKLRMFYAAEGTSEARGMANKLDSETRNGDVAVFTGLRGLPVLYYLDRLGNKWDASYCRSAVKGRSFYCRMYPRDTEKTPAATSTERLLGSTDVARAEAADYLARLDPQSGTFWVVLWGAAPGGKVKIPAADRRLFSELKRAGLVTLPDPDSHTLLFTKLKKK